MKAYQFILGIALATCVTACNFLESESPSAMDAKSVYTNATLTGQAIAGVYDLLGADKGYRNRLACGYMGMNTDIEHNTKNSGNADYAVYMLTTVSSDLTNAQGKDPWGYFNIAIERCNNIIEGLEAEADLTNPDFAYYLGEAYFLRSFLYLDMVKLWGDVPARFESVSKNPASAKTPKTDRNVIYEHLRGDLKKAAEYLPWSSECPGAAKNRTDRPSKAAAYALLMRNDMHYAGRSIRPATYQTGPVENVEPEMRKELYGEVLWAFSHLQAGPGEDAKLLQDKGDMSGFERVFRNVCEDMTNYYESEMIWEIPFNDGARGQFLQYNCPKSSNALKGLKNNTSGSTNSVVSLVPTLYFDYDPKDIRRDITIAKFEWRFDDGSNVNKDKEKRKSMFPEVDIDNNEKFLYQKFQMIDNWYLGKYRVEWMKRERNGNDDGINFPVIRYADVLLMAAEATLGGVTGDVPSDLYGVDGKACFDRIRTRAKMETKALTMENLQEERKLELAGEYVRKWDLMRWGILKEKLIAEHERIAKLNDHTDVYSDLPDTIYFKYKKVDSNVYCYTPDIKGYVIDSIYGLQFGEKGRPASYSAENKWISKALYQGDNGRELAPSKYILFNRDFPDHLNSRQLWPIFAVNLGEDFLWNDYGYDN